MTTNEAELATRLHHAVDAMLAGAEVAQRIAETITTLLPSPDHPEIDQRLVEDAQRYVRDTKAYAARLLDGVPVIEESA